MHRKSGTSTSRPARRRWVRAAERLRTECTDRGARPTRCRHCPAKTR